MGRVAGRKQKQPYIYVFKRSVLYIMHGRSRKTRRGEIRFARVSTIRRANAALSIEGACGSPLVRFVWARAGPVELVGCIAKPTGLLSTSN